MKNKIFLVASFALTIIIAVPDSASARYLDPGTGSMIIQVLIASIATALLFFKSALQNVKMVLFKILGKEIDLED